MLRFLLVSLTIAAVLLALLVAAAFSPLVQTWAVERWLNGQTGVTATVGEVAAGLSVVEVTDLRIGYRGATLKVPSAELTLPVFAAIWERRMAVQRLVAKGWVLELRPSDGAKASADTTGAGATRATGWLDGWSLPGDLHLSGVEVEGDVVVTLAGSKEPLRAHGTIKGGGLGAVSRGEFAVEGIVTVPDSGRWPEAYGIDGKVAVTLATPRKVARLAYEGRVTARGDTFPDDLRFAAAITAAGATPESYEVIVSRAGRRVAAVTGAAEGTAGGWRGNWELDLQDGDVAGLWPAVAFPTGRAAGRGAFEADVSFSQLRANGRWQGAISAWGAGRPALHRLGPVRFTADVTAVRDGNGVRLERGEAEVGGTRPIARLRSLQPWRYDWATGETKAADPAADWFEGALSGVPVGLFSGLLDDFELAGNDLSGEFSVGPAPDGFVARSKAPSVAAGIAVTRQGRPLAGGLDVSVAWQVRHSPRGWRWQLTPLQLSAAGQPLAKLDLTIMPLGERARSAWINGTWEVDLDGLARQPMRWVERGRLPGRTASGTVDANLGTATEITSKLKVVGHDPARTLAADVQVHRDARGQVTGKAPLTFTAGPQSTEVTVSGAWYAAQGGPRLDLQLEGVSVDLAPLRVLTGKWLAEQGLPWWQDAVTRGPAAARDARPFWGEWRGELKFNCYQLRAAPYDLTQVTGTLTGDGHSVRLTGGKGTVMPPAEPPPDPKKPRPPRGPEVPRRQVTADGAIAFDEKAAQPYGLEAAATVDLVEFSELLGFAKPPAEAVLEGRVAVAAGFTSRGGSLRELIETSSAEYRITGRNGIARLLKANIADGITEDKPSAVGDALAGAGSLLGTVLGLGRDSIHTGARNLPKATEAVLNFTYQLGELRYDELSLTARSGADGAVAVTAFALTAPRVRLHGTGRLSPVDGQPAGRGVLELELAMGVRGTWAELLAPADLLAAEKDGEGYTPFRETVRLGGTPERIDSPAWREQLLKAAVAPLAKVKK